MSDAADGHVVSVIELARILSIIRRIASLIGQRAAFDSAADVVRHELAQVEDELTRNERDALLMGQIMSYTSMSRLFVKGIEQVDDALRDAERIYEAYCEHTGLRELANEILRLDASLIERERMSEAHDRT
jgi:hypothetical protein